MSVVHQNSLRGQAIEELQSNQCVCGERKKSGNSFCHLCYFRLPPKMRQALYRTFSDGYAEDYDAAKDYLKTSNA
ncbi:MAG: hypothetical protein HY231_24175 [Acidobacteria bacterium]|nr:hypothetical protein [Acidobacteriota bacterium]